MPTLEQRGIIRLDARDFQNGIANPALPGQAEVMTNLVATSEGLERRPGLNTLELALTDGGSPAVTPEGNRSIFWHHPLQLWIIGGGDSDLWSGPAAGALTQRLSAYAAMCPRRQMITNSLVAAGTIVGSGFDTDAGPPIVRTRWTLTNAGVWAAQANTTYALEQVRNTRGLAIVTGQQALSGGAYKNSVFVGDGVSTALDVMCQGDQEVLACGTFGEEILFGLSDGVLLKLSGDYASRRYDEVTKLPMEVFLPFTFEESQYGLFFCTNRSAYLWDGALHDLIRDRQDTVNPLWETIDAADANLAMALWFEQAGEYWVGFEDSSNDWQTYIFDARRRYWRKFAAVLFDNGSLGIKNGELYIALDGYGSTVPGIYRTNGSNVADPSGNITCTYRPGWQYAPEGQFYNMLVHDVYVAGAGWDSAVTLHYTDIDGTDTTLSLTLVGQWARVPGGGIECRRCKPEIVATITTAQGTKVVNLRDLSIVYSIAGVTN